MPECTRHAGNAGLGQWLLTTREVKGISLSEAAEATRIQKNYIDALEKEDFERLPAPAYCKGFIRLYALYLGISPDDAIARYDMVMSGETASVPRTVNQRIASDNVSTAKSRKRWVLPLTLFSLVVLMSLFFDSDEPPSVRRPPPLSEPVASVLPVPVQPVRSSAHTVPLPTSAVPETVVPPEAVMPETSEGGVLQEGLILRLKINQDSWLNVDIDGLVSKQYELKGGDLIEWKADSVITLDIGNAGGVEGEVNDTPLPSFGASGKKAHAVIRPEGVVLR